MKKLLLLTPLCCLGLVSRAQDSLTLYYTSAFVRTDDTAKATFVRKTIFKDSLWFVNDYYKGKVLIESGSYYVLDTVREGHFIEYNGKGGKLSEGDYLQNVQVGKWTTWYENGNVSSEEIFLDDIPSITGLIKTDKRIGARFVWNVNSRSGYGGIRSGLNTWYHENGQKSAEEIYKNGKIRKAKFWDENGKEVKVDIKDYYSNEEPPKFEENFDVFFRRHMEYPPNVKISGTMYISVKVKRDGTLEDYKIFRSSGSEALDNEALRVAKLMSGKFTPDITHNRKREIYYTFPVRF